MKASEYDFIETYESKCNELHLLNILKDNLTEKGKETKLEIEKYLTENLDKYLEIKEN